MIGWGTTRRSYFSEVRAEQAEVGRLEPVVKLRHDRPTKLLDHGREAVVAAGLGMAIDEPGELLDHLHIVDHLLAHAGPLHLDGDGAAVTQHGAVHLAERRAGHGLGVERLERLGDAGPELGGDGLFDRAERNRFNVVLEAGQGVEVDGREQVGPGRQELTELDERGAHGLELIDEFLSVFLGSGVDGLGVLRVEVLDAVRAPVFDEERGDVLVTREMVDLQRESHFVLDYPISTTANRGRLPESRALTRVYGPGRRVSLWQVA